MSEKLKGSLMLLLCAILWGMCFSAQSSASAYVQPFTFLFMRSLITGGVLFAVLPLIHRIAPPEKGIASGANHWKIGALMGVFLMAASALQQIGIQTVSAAKSGFITALYVVIVPVLGLLLGKRPKWTVYLGMALSVAGLFLLCVKGSDFASVGMGDLYTLLCALVFSVHVLCIDRYGNGMDSVLLSAIQFTVCGVLAAVCAFIFETPRVEGMKACIGYVLYAAIFSGAMGYTLQIMGQKRTDPTVASVIMCLESVFAAVGGWILLGESLSARELTGCALMLSASVIAQLSPDKSDQEA